MRHIIQSYCSILLIIVLALFWASPASAERKFVVDDHIGCSTKSDLRDFFREVRARHHRKIIMNEFVADKGCVHLHDKTYTILKMETDSSKIRLSTGARRTLWVDTTTLLAGGSTNDGPEFDIAGVWEIWYNGKAIGCATVGRVGKYRREVEGRFEGRKKIYRFFAHADLSRYYDNDDVVGFYYHDDGGDGASYSTLKTELEQSYNKKSFDFHKVEQHFRRGIAVVRIDRNSAIGYLQAGENARGTVRYGDADVGFKQNDSCFRRFD